MPVPPGVYIDADGKGLHGPDGEPIDGVVVEGEEGTRLELAEDHDRDVAAAAIRGRAQISEAEFDALAGEAEPDMTPSAEEILDDAGIDPKDVAPGSGENGRILKADAEDAVETLEEDGSEEESDSEEEDDESEDEEDESSAGGGAVDFASDEAAEVATGYFDEDVLTPSDLAGIQGSGEDGSLTVDDIEVLAEEKREEDEDGEDEDGES